MLKIRKVGGRKLAFKTVETTKGQSTSRLIRRAYRANKKQPAVHLQALAGTSGTCVGPIRLLR